MDLAGTLHRQGMTILLVSHHLLPLRGRVETVIWIAGRHLITGSAEVMLSKEKIAEFDRRAEELGNEMVLRAKFDSLTNFLNQAHEGNDL